MRKIKKFFILFTMLIAGLSFKGANNADKNVVADAATSGSYAYFSVDWKTKVTKALSNQGVDPNLFKTILITNDGSKVTARNNLLDGCPVEVGITKYNSDNSNYTPENYYTNGRAVGAYIYPNEADATMFDCILYADVETIYSNKGSYYDRSYYDYLSFFSKLSNVEKITFDCTFSMAKAADRNMINMFYGCKNLVQIEGLKNIDITNVTNMSGLFWTCRKLATIDVSCFDTSNINEMSKMFAGCSSLIELDVSNFDTTNVVNMNGMFGWCEELLSIKGLENFKTSQVTDMSWMFYNDRKLTEVDLSFFDTSKVTDMSYMFGWCKELTTIKGLENFNTSNVTDMQEMFSSCSGLTELDVSSFDTSKVTNMYGMFGWCNNLPTIKGLENFNTSNVTNMSRMFTSCSSLTEIDVSNFDTSNVTDMSNMFSGCSSLTALDVNHFNTTNVTNMNSMFSSCSNLTALDVSHFDTTNVTDMSWMFANCYELKELDVSSFDTSKVTDMSYMFAYCDSLTIIKGLNSEKWNTSNVTSMEKMFSYCEKITALDLSNFDLSSITDATKLDSFINGMTLLKEVKAPKNMNGYTIKFNYTFDMDEIDSSMEGWTLLQGSKEFNILYNTLLRINVCTEYAKAPELQAMYDGLSNEEKDKLATLSDDSGVILTDKLSYMVSYADYKANEATKTAETHLVISPRTSQYLVIVIACLSLALIGGYYFIQKKKYAK